MIENKKFQTQSRIEKTFSDSVMIEALYQDDGQLNSTALANSARILFDHKDYKSAREIYVSLVRSKQCLDIAYLGLARCYEKEANTASAIRYYEEAIAYNPKLESYQRFAALLMKEEKYQTAAEVLERACLIRNMSMGARVSLYKHCAENYNRVQLFHKAERNCLKALELDPDNNSIITILAQVLIHQKRLNEARFLLENRISRKQVDSHLLNLLADLEFAEAHLTAAYSYWSQSLHQNINQADILIKLIKAAYELKEFGTAEKILCDYIDSSPFNTNLLYTLAGMRFHLGMYHKALNVIDSIERIHPGHVEATKLRRMIEKKLMN